MIRGLQAADQQLGKECDDLAAVDSVPLDPDSQPTLALLDDVMVRSGAQRLEAMTGFLFGAVRRQRPLLNPCRGNLVVVPQRLADYART